jgi:hypothetical protein
LGTQARGLFYFLAVGAGDVLEELLDQVDVGEDHTTAAVALQTDGVEGVAGERGGLVEGLGDHDGPGGVDVGFERGRRMEEGLHFFGTVAEEAHVFLPQVAGDLRLCQYVRA